ncbi:hypothetical protein Cgig2_005039 [Carnegiea gigantea]|uniref:Uncharacterized protein n=1 Tax=Carnegiea gigantea TaxID=171969 RepID=A0A9Q1L1D2_9CARY|nr:hypothetical protein Cgig2_005039 [Carnegiea gigantea]
MKISRNLIISSLISSLHLLCKSNGQYCAPMRCSYSQTSVGFPFHIKNRQPPDSGGCLGFDVCLEKYGYLFLREKLLSIGLTKISPFRSAEQYAIFNLYNCSGICVNYLSYDIIHCFTGFMHTIISLKADAAVRDSERTILKNISAPSCCHGLDNGVIYLT